MVNVSVVCTSSHYKSPFKSICHCRTQSHQTSNSTVVECTLYIKLDELLFVVVWYILWVSQVWAFVFKQEFQFLTLISIAHNLSIIQLKSMYANLKGNSRRVSWNKKKCQFFLATSWKWANLWVFFHLIFVDILKKTCWFLDNEGEFSWMNKVFFLLRFEVCTFIFSGKKSSVSRVTSNIWNLPI